MLETMILNSLRLGKKNNLKRKYFNYEVLAGYGLGYMNYENKKDFWPADYQFNMSADRYNLFLQPNFGYKVKNILEVGIFSRFIYTKYYNLNTTFNSDDKYTPDPVDKYFMNKSYVDFMFAEPGVSAKLGFKYLKLNMQVCKPLSLTGEDFRYRDVILYLGISFSFDCLKETEK
jgi:hypothetical protein